jgi:hypothetical protein
VFAADVDGDGDTDVLSASNVDDKIAWYENNGSQNFISHTIAFGVDGASSVFAADVDGDGDTDVLSASNADDKIAWYENNGSPNFTHHTISTAANGAFSVFAADMDGDGDLDALSASVNDDKIAWYENGVAKFGGLQSTPRIPTPPPLPLPLPPGRGLHAAFTHSAFTRLDAPLQSLYYAIPAEAPDAAFIDSSYHEGVRTSVVRRSSGTEWTETTPDILRLLDNVFAGGDGWGEQ